MNAKELYLTIGQIDDDLILGANEKRGKREKGIRLWMAAAAACFCLLLGGGYLHFFGTSIIWNAGTAEYVTKSIAPANSMAQSLSTEALTDYYHITPPDRLGDLSRMPANVQLYTDTDGSVLYDRNVLHYENTDGSKSVKLTLSRVSSLSDSSGETASRIRGVSVVLTEDASISGSLRLSAQWEQDGTTIHLASEGLSKGELIAVIEELI